MSGFRLNKLCIIGIGTIAGSLARALRAHASIDKIVAYGRNPERLQVAKELQVVDEVTLDLATAVTNADMIIVSTPLGAMPEIFTKLKGLVATDTIITDVGSSKKFVIDSMLKSFGELLVRFVPGHPIAGTEKSGVESSVADLFIQRRVILTPHEATDANALEIVRSMWQACGAEVVDMSPEHHDEVLAATSHLPHMLAYALVDTLARMDDQREIFEYAAGGFRDFTRIASSDPQMWHDICIANREQLVNILHAFNQDLLNLTKAVESGDSRYLKETFMRAKKARDQFCG